MHSVKSFIVRPMAGPLLNIVATRKTDANKRVLVVTSSLTLQHAFFKLKLAFNFEAPIACDDV